MLDCEVQRHQVNGPGREWDLRRHLQSGSREAGARGENIEAELEDGIRNVQTESFFSAGDSEASTSEL